MPRQSGPFQQLKNCGAAVSASLMATVDDQFTDPIAAIVESTPHITKPTTSSATRTAIGRHGPSS
jgi:hypothetical protein